MTPDDTFALAIARHEDGDLAQARRLYESVLLVDPHHSLALHRLGVLLLESGDAKAAATRLQAATARTPPSGILYCDLATALNACGNAELAEATYEKALGTDQNLVEAHYGLGALFLSQSRLDEAMASLHRAVTIDPDYAEAQFLIGAAQRQSNHPSQSIPYYRKALDIDPRYTLAQLGLASALRETGKYDAAAAEYRKAIALDPSSAEAYNGLALVQDAMDLSDQALVNIEKALALQPNSAEIYANRGTLLQVAGDLSAARVSFSKACELEPKRPAHFFALVNSSGLPLADEHIQRMIELSHHADELAVEERIRLHFALNKALSDADRPQEAFEYLVKANVLKRREIAYDEVATLRLFDRIRDVFSPDFVDRHKECGTDSALPIFIVGMPRSGSTLVEQILATSPRVVSGGERDDFRNCIQTVGGDSAASKFPESMAQLQQAQFGLLGAHYIKRMNALADHGRSPETRVTDKTLMHFALLGLIRIVLPNARIIHIRRDPIETCLSCYSKLFGDNLPFAYDLGELGRYYREYERIMEYWNATLPQDWILNIQYEQLVEDFETQARRMFFHCDVAWDDACLAFHKTKRTVRTASSAQVRQPLYRTSLKKWRPSDEQLSALLAALN